MEAVKNMNSVVCITPGQTPEQRSEAFAEWYVRHEEKKSPKESFEGPIIPGPKETRAMLRKRGIV